MYCLLNDCKLLNFRKHFNEDKNDTRNAKIQCMCYELNIIISALESCDFFFFFFYWESTLSSSPTVNNSVMYFFFAHDTSMCILYTNVKYGQTVQPLCWLKSQILVN